MIVGLVTPLSTSVEYIPVDDDVRIPVDLWTPLPEEMAPWLFRLLFAYLDPLVYLAYRDPTSVLEKLPPLGLCAFVESANQECLPIPRPIL